MLHLSTLFLLLQLFARRCLDKVHQLAQIEHQSSSSISSSSSQIEHQSSSSSSLHFSEATIKVSNIVYVSSSDSMTHSISWE